MLLAALSGAALGYPDRPVRLIVPYPPGQATDIVARVIAQKLAARLGQHFVVDNRSGAAAILGHEIAMKAAPDGYTLLMSSSGPLAINPGLYSKLPYDSLKDFDMIGRATIVPQFLVVNPGVPAASVRDLVELAKSKPGQLSYATGGAGQTNHLIMELFRSAAGIDVLHVPFKGSVAAVTDVIAGRIQMMFETGAASLPHVRSSRLRALAVSSIKRSPAAPEIPTVAESGFPGFDNVAWICLIAPKGTPQAVIMKLNAQMRSALEQQDVRDTFANVGTEPAPTTPQELREFVVAEIAKWGRAVKQSGAKIE